MNDLAFGSWSVVIPTGTSPAEIICVTHEFRWKFKPTHDLKINQNADNIAVLDLLCSMTGTRFWTARRPFWIFISKD